MSHTEIWDDSALVNSWNEAVEEYNHYHSIHARGETVEEVLKVFQENENGFHETILTNDSGRQEEIVIPNGAMGNGNEEGFTEEAKADQAAENKLSQANRDSKSKRSEDISQRIPAPLSQHLIGSGLKSLLMSWYYAGYYTGLYEGQHQER